LLQLAASKLQSFDTPAWEKDIYTFIEEWLNEKDHIVVNTSGSTGTPKSIELKKEWVKYSAQQTCSFFNLNSISTALLCLPAAYIAGKMMIVRAFVSGLNLISVEPTGNPFHSLPTNHPIDFSAITPFQLNQSINILKSNSPIKKLIVGGGEISRELEKEVSDISVDIFATYGMTETSSHIALRKVNGNDKKDYYTVIGDTKINLDSRECLTIKNPYLFDGELITNDLVEIIDENSFRWLGRYDNIINSGGIKIMPEEIEKAIGNLRSETMIVSEIDDKKLGSAIVLVLEVEELSELEKLSLLSEIKSLIKPYANPKHVFTLNSIPRTSNGKIDRVAVKAIIKRSDYKL
jgi:o-succinylbenzoate---CoA ligase